MRTIVLAALALTACRPLATPRDVSGNYDVAFADNLRVYIDDTLVAESTSGEDATIEWNGESFTITTLCGDEGVDCPSETFWNVVAVDQPWGPGYRLLNFVNLDVEHGEGGARIGGLMDDDGTFAMLSGLALGGKDHCAAVGVGTVTGAFVPASGDIDAGVLTYGWAAGCDVGDTTIAASLRLETDYTATRTGDYDVSSVTPSEPIDESGEVVDPEAPEEGYAVGGDTGASDSGA